MHSQLKTGRIDNTLPKDNELVSYYFLISLMVRMTKRVCE